MTLKIRAAAALTAIAALGACTNPALLDPNDPNYNRNQGVLLGAGIGAALGNIVGGDTEATIAGAVVGGAAGGIIGNQLDKQEAELRAQLANDGITIANAGDRLIVSLPQDITFATDSFAIRPSLRADLDRVAANLLRYPNSTVQVIGHTDSDGDAAYNVGLSRNRANAVADVLQAGGVPFERLQIIARGESQPIASNLTPEGKALNRRVEIVIVPRGA